MNRVAWLPILLLAYSLAHSSDELPVADSVLVDKSERKMWLIHNGEAYREYDVSLGDSPEGHKQQEGDERTPEGHYTLDYRNPKSRYHLSIHISYPNSDDKAKANSNGISPGGDIFIHGTPNGIGWAANYFNGIDWTDGCIAVSDREMDEIWELVENGTPIEIRP